MRGFFSPLLSVLSCSLALAGCQTSSPFVVKGNIPFDGVLEVTK